MIIDIDINNIGYLYGLIKDHRKIGGKWYRVTKKREIETKVKKFIFFVKKELLLHEEDKIFKISDIVNDFGQYFFLFQYEFDNKKNEIVKYKYLNNFDFYPNGRISIESLNNEIFDNMIKKQFNSKHLDIDPYGEEDWDD